MKKNKTNNSEPITDITQLRIDLSKAYNELRNGQITKSKADRICKIAHKIIMSCKVQFEYSQDLGLKQNIKYLNEND